MIKRKPWRFLLIDDHAVVREGIKRMFDDNPADAVFGEAGTLPEAIRMVEAEPWDIAIADLSLGERSGLDLLKSLKQLRPHLPVLILTMHAEEKYALRAFKSGASGYVTKCSSRTDLLAAIKKTIQGGRYVSAELAERLVTDLSRAGDGPPHEALSDREFEVLRLIGSGKTVSEIADLLFLSDKTISTYRSRILEKMAMKNNAELTRYAIQYELVD